MNPQDLPGEIDPRSTIELLGYRTRKANPLQQVVQNVAASRPGAWLLQRTVHRLDRVFFRLSGGRMTIAGLVAGLPVVMLSTTGAKSGQKRTTPLVGIPIEDDLAVIGSNFGQDNTPGWVFNLESDPAAVISYRERWLDVHARVADDAEADAAFVHAAKVYPGYANYRDRANHRRIRVFLLSAR
ncbi:MAG: nitroreductase family deazaflavin-dependent oxidoreductase [Acidimicrobiales bacterium]